MKIFIKNELESLVNYLKKNWGHILFSLSLGLLLFWFLLLKQSVLSDLIQKADVSKPPLSFVLIFECLLFLSLYGKLVSLWSCYRKSYFAKDVPFSWVDRVLVLLLPVVYLVCFQTFSTSEYFLFTASCLIFFILVTYATSIILQIEDYLERKKFERDEFTGKTVLFSDEPINNNEQDSIGRGSFALALKENIYNLSFSESFVMALYGRWGEGKTSILNLLKKEIRKENRLLIYEFDPWFYGDENALTTNFYRGLEDLLQENYFIPRKIKKILKFYPEVLIKGFANIGFNFESKNDEDRPIELKKEIESFVNGLDKRVLVVIDDIDRLQKDEILAVFRLVKLTSHIKNLVFLISFDTSRVVSLLKSEDFEDPQSYIEKIVQLPINLPMTDQGKVDQFLLYSFPATGHKSEIDKLFDRLELDPIKRQEFDKEFVQTYQTNLRPIFSTYRAAKRYMNSILFRLPFIEREVFLYDFFIIEVIQTFYPELYADMKSSPWYYLSTKWSFYTLATSPLPYDDVKRKVIIKAHIDKLTENILHKDAVRSLLESIFPQIKSIYSSGNYHSDSEKARIDKRIFHPECYPKYFMLGTRDGVIPDAEFEDLLKRWKNSEEIEVDLEKSFFDKYQRELKLIQLFEKLKLHAGLIDKVLVLPVIRVLYKNCIRLQREGEFWMTEFDQADGVILRLIEDRKDIIKDEEIHPLIVEIIKQTPGHDLASLIVLTCNEGTSNSIARIRANVDISELRTILDARLTEYFITNRIDIFQRYPHEREYSFILYQWATNWGLASSETKEKVSDYLVSLFKENPTRASFFLRHYVKEDRPFHDKKYFDYKGFVVAYNADKFAVCLAELGDSAFSTETEKEAITLFIGKYNEAARSVIPTNI